MLRNVIRLCIGLCLGGGGIQAMIPIASTQQAHPVEKAYYEQYQRMQPQGFSVYWLFLPHYNDYVLIQTQGTNPPMLNANGTPEFRYIDPTPVLKTPQNGYSSLPPGLYCWRSDYEPQISGKPAQAHTQARIQGFAPNATIVRNQPGDKTFAREQNSAKYKESLPGNKAPGTEWQRSRHVFIPGTPAQMQAITPQRKIDLSQRPNTITLATVNTLAQNPYQMVRQQFQQRPAPEMPINLRKYLFANAVKNPYMLKNTDFICVQEWDTSLASGISGYGYVGAHTQKLTAGIFYEKRRWHLKEHEMITIQHDGKQKFAPIATFYDTYRRDTRYITIASCHLPGGVSQQDKSSHVGQVRDAAYKQAHKYNAHIIIAGDFNFNTYSQQHYGYPAKPQQAYHVNQLASMMQSRKQFFYDAASYVHTKMDTGDIAFDPILQTPDPKYLPTSYNDGFERMDYIWYSPQLNPIQYRMFPVSDALWHLVAHGKNARRPYYSYYFSDHATLRAVFRY